jgi:hypothetical protein
MCLIWFDLAGPKPRAVMIGLPSKKFGQPESVMSEQGIPEELASA